MLGMTKNNRRKEVLAEILAVAVVFVLFGLAGVVVAGLVVLAGEGIRRLRAKN
jgi:hypothetical protein